MPIASMPLYPVYIHFTGQAGEQERPQCPNGTSHGSVYGFIATLGINGDAPYANPVLLTCKDQSARALCEGNIYSMTCRMIGSNTQALDHFHYTKSSLIRLGKSNPADKDWAPKLVNKVSITVVGLVIARETVYKHEAPGVSTLLLTIRSSDIDPINGTRVEWVTKHHVATDIQDAQDMDRYQKDAEVFIHGILIDYDIVTHTWESEVRFIKVTGAPEEVTHVTPDNLTSNFNAFQSQNTPLASKRYRSERTLNLELNNSRNNGVGIMYDGFLAQYPELTPPSSQTSPTIPGMLQRPSKRTRNSQLTI